MVNTGHPSRACQGCRAIKSKCDEEKPSCKRCTRIGKPCVYRDSDPMFRSMNKWSEKTVELRVSNKLAAREAEEVQCTENYLPSLPMLVSMQWENHAIGPFFDRFINQPDRFGSTWGFLTWLPKSFADQSISAVLADATRACALANLANASKIPELNTQAGRSYGLALKGLHVALCDRGNAASNETLATMMLLALYEIVTGLKPPKEMFQAHMKGQAAAMRLRVKRHTLSAVESSVASHTNRALLWRDLANRTGPKYALSDWPPGMYRSWLDELSARFTSEVADVCGRIQEMHERASAYGTVNSNEELGYCTRAAVELDDSYKLNLASAPMDWLPVKGHPQQRSAIPDKTPSQILANKECSITNWKVGKQNNMGKHYNLNQDTYKEPYYPRFDIYPSHPIALLWSSIRCARLHLLRGMIDLHLLLKQRPNQTLGNLPSLEDVRTSISDTVHDICAVFPYLLGDFYAGLHNGLSDPCMSSSLTATSADATVSLWLLHKVLAVPGISSAIRTWALGVCERIGTVGNIRQGNDLKLLYSQEQPMLD